MAILLLIPRKGYNASQDADTFRKLPELAARAAKSKTHFLVTIDPEEYEVFASLGSFEEVVADDTGAIRLNLTMFDPDGQT